MKSQREREREWGTQVLVLPHLERAAQDGVLPRVKVRWTARELGRLRELAFAAAANPPTEAPIQAMRD